MLFLAIIFILALGLRLILTYTLPVKYWDETIYLNLGRNLVTYHEYSFQHGFADFYPNWPLAGGRPPLLPVLAAFNFLFTDSLFFLNLAVPLIGCIGIIFLFLFTKKLFNTETAIYSSIIFAFFPMAVFFGSKFLTDTVLLTLFMASIYFLIKAYESSAKSKIYLFSILFGFFLGLTFLTRYTALWLYPVVGFWLIIKRKGLRFVFEKQFITGLITFLIIIAPWFIANFFSYGNLFGFLNDSAVASVRWGEESFFFYFLTLLSEFWFILPLIIIGLIASLSKKSENKNKWLILFWFIFIFFAASMTAGKESRYLLPILPAASIISSWGIIYLKGINKTYFKVALGVIVTGLAIYYILFGLSSFTTYRAEDQKCFFNSMDFIKNSGASEVVTEHFTAAYFYTQVPNIRVNNYTIIKEIIANKPSNVLYYYKNGDWFNLKNEKPDLELAYSCGDYFVYKLK